MKTTDTPLAACPICARADGPLRAWLTVPGDWRRPSVRQSYRLWWCDRCQHGSLLPRPSEAEVAESYQVEAYYTHQGSSPGASNEPGGHSLPVAGRVLRKLAWRLGGKVRRPINAEMLKAHARRDPVSATSPGRPRVIDLGCGDGALLAEARETGFEGIGVDPDPAARSAAGARGIQVFDGTAEHLPRDLPPDWADVVVMQHALEHAIDPVRALRNAMTLVRPGGRLICEVPNSSAVGLKLSGIAWPWLDVPRHLSFFTVGSLRTAAERAGWTPVEHWGNGLARQFEPSWTQNEREIAARFGAMGTRCHATSAWKLLAACARAKPIDRADSIAIVARRNS